MNSSGLLLSLASLLLVVLALTPFIEFAGDLSNRNIVDIAWKPLETETQGVKVGLTLTYKGTVPLTDVNLRIETFCGGKTCQSQEASTKVLMRGERLDIQFFVPFNASSVRISFESKIAGLYTLKAVTETGVPGYGFPG
ncbi:hypothetical protein [Thermofilum sp.]|uniref:hypothetical protein n=1 Tax=Thermofilum sp. TaxID=1961369 RepID=UPI0031721DCD